MSEEIPYIKRDSPDCTELNNVGEQQGDNAHLCQIILDDLPFLVKLVRANWEIVASNQAAVRAGAVPGERCFSTWGERKDPCTWCLAPIALETGKAQHLEVEQKGILWDTHWIPIGCELYLRFAFDKGNLETSLNNLSTREGEILRLIAKGKLNKEIADLLFISIRTVEHHREHIKKKLGLRTTADLVRYAIRRRYILSKD